MDPSQTGRGEICMGLWLAVNKLQGHKRKKKKWNLAEGNNSLGTALGHLLHRDKYICGETGSDPDDRTFWLKSLTRALCRRRCKNVWHLCCHRLWPGEAPHPVKSWSGIERRSSRFHRASTHGRQTAFTAAEWLFIFHSVFFWTNNNSSRLS